MSERIRTFISVDIPVNDDIRGLLGDLRTRENIRASPVSQIHITLKFLGDTYADRIPKLCSKLRENLSGTEGFELVMKGVGAFPNVKNPRVVWIGFEDSDRLMDLSSKVDDAVHSLKLNCDDKRFSPHVTMGRISGPADISDIISDNKGKEFCRFRCSCVNVMKSELTPKGAVHTILDRIELID